MAEVEVNTEGNHSLFLHEQLAHLDTGNTQKKVSKIASDEDIMENNYMFVMLWNLSSQTNNWIALLFCTNMS